MPLLQVDHNKLIIVRLSPRKLGELWGCFPGDFDLLCANIRQRYSLKLEVLSIKLSF